jgi:hypothetical protein
MGRIAGAGKGRIANPNQRYCLPPRLRKQQCAGVGRYEASVARRPARAIRVPIEPPPDGSAELHAVSVQGNHAAAPGPPFDTSGIAIGIVNSRNGSLKFVVFHSHTAGFHPADLRPLPDLSFRPTCVTTLIITTARNPGNRLSGPERANFLRSTCERYRSAPIRKSPRLAPRPLGLAEGHIVSCDGKAAQHFPSPPRQTQRP